MHEYEHKDFIVDFVDEYDYTLYSNIMNMTAGEVHTIRNDKIYFLSFAESFHRLHTNSKLYYPNKFDTIDSDVQYLFEKDLLQNHPNLNWHAFTQKMEIKRKRNDGWSTSAPMFYFLDFSSLKPGLSYIQTAKKQVKLIINE